MGGGYLLLDAAAGPEVYLMDWKLVDVKIEELDRGRQSEREKWARGKGVG